MPDCLNPPNGISTGVRLNALIQQVPACNSPMTLCARWMSRVNTPADSPNSVALARQTTSSSASKESTVITGPKISSRAIRISSVTSAKTVGSTKKPPSKPCNDGIPPPTTSRAPSCLPISM